MANTKNVTSLLEEKRKISKEIENLQSKCNHSYKSVMPQLLLLDGYVMIVKKL